MHKAPKEHSTRASEPPPLARQVKVDDLKDGGEGVIEATAAECGAIVELLDLAALRHLTFAYRVRHHGGGRIGLKGTLQAAVTQTCVVSLEPVESILDMPVEAEFWPRHLIEALDREAEDKDHVLRDWPEPIFDGKIDLGTVVYEMFATALDPYPKREGANPEDEDRPEGPFAALARLKQG